MSAKQTTEYFCDRCDASLGTKNPTGTVQVKAYIEGEWAPEINCNWSHLCPTCRDDVTNFFKAKP